MNNTTESPTHMFIATPLDVRTIDGTIIRHVEPVFRFNALPENAESVFFMNGYNLTSEKGLFKSSTPEPQFGYIVETFDTTDGSNSTEDDVPNRLSILLEGTYAGYPTENLRFGKLQVMRSILRKGGKYRKSRKSVQRKRKTRRHRK